MTESDDELLDVGVLDELALDDVDSVYDIETEIFRTPM